VLVGHGEGIHEDAGRGASRGDHARPPAHPILGLGRPPRARPLRQARPLAVWGAKACFACESSSSRGRGF
jgi:hypothetical protein